MRGCGMRATGTCSGDSRKVRKGVSDKGIDPRRKRTTMVNGRLTQFNVLCQTGKVRCLGVSNFNQRHLEALLADPSITHPPRVNQVYKSARNARFD
jgi:diketogulonate reductase-like aldo/keto reductase